MDFEKYAKEFDLFNNHEAQIMRKGSYNDYEKTYVLEDIGTVSGDLQPYSSELAKKEYGLSAECQKRFYCGTNENITEGVWLIFGAKKYEAVGVIGWETGMEIMLKEIYDD